VALAAALEIARLKEREDGDTADDIATVRVGMFTPSKVEDIFKRGLLKTKAAPVNLSR